MKDKKVAVVGAGSIGLYYGGKLADTGHDVRFLMRSGFEEARREGIHIYSSGRDIHLAKPQVLQSTSEIGPADLVLISVKATSNEALPALLPPLLTDHTLLLTLQNGLGNEEFLAARYGENVVLGGLCFVCLTRRSPASVDHFGHGALSVGALSQALFPKAQEIAGAFRTSGINAKAVPDLQTERWKKLVWNVPFNGLSVAAGGVTVDRILSDAALHQECRMLMREIIAIAGALGHPIEEGYEDFQIERSYTMGSYQPSTLVDWRKGSELEVEAIWGEPLQRARQAGVPAPHLERLHQRLVACNAANASRAGAG